MKLLPRKGMETNRLTELVSEVVFHNLLKLLPRKGMETVAMAFVRIDTVYLLLKLLPRKGMETFM